MLKDFTPRLYQQTILGTAANKNTLVVLPTGLGKTAVALLLSAQRLTLYPQSKILMLAPTKPLCEQHQTTFQKHLDKNVTLFTGNISPKKRAELWDQAQIIISTPQGLENDIINKRISLKDVSLLIFDEAHHAVKDYAYVWIAQQYEEQANYGRTLALTASPGSDMEKIREICSNLKIEKIEIRTEKDADVKQYLQKTKLNWVEVNLPESYKEIQTHLRNCKQAKLLEMQKHGYLKNSQPTKTELLQLQGILQKEISQGNREFELLRSISLLAETLKVEHALELLESQGIGPLKLYLNNLQQQCSTTKIKAVKNLFLDENFKSAFYLTGENNTPHPKLKQLKDMVMEQLKDNPQAKIIIFTQFRDSAEIILKELENYQAKLFFGQAKKKGLGFSQKEQKEILEQFRNNEFSVLIATSVAEEGLDIPRVDKVIFYEPIPSAIRSIQRRGRTGRLEKGEVTLLVTKNTRDQGYRWSSFHKEKRMYRNLETLKTTHLLKEEPTTLKKFITKEQPVLVLADHREKDNKVVKELIELGISVKTEQLTSADYLLSGRVAVELKKVPDFVNSIIDGRLLEQVRNLKNNFEKTLLIIEGEEDIYSIRKVHANAIKGMLSSIVLDFAVPILYTKNSQDTAALLAVMAKREQNKETNFSLHDQKPQTFAEQQEYLVSSLPNIGLSTAKILLENFSTIKNLTNATEEQLINIKGIGEKTAQRLTKLFAEEYKQDK